MASAPPDYFGLVRTPNDFSLARARTGLTEAQIPLAEAQTQGVIAEALQRQREAQTRAAYQEAINNVRGSPTPDNISGLMAQFPEYAQELRQAYLTQAEGMQRRNVDAAASVWALLQRGEADRALTLLEHRREALTQAGESTEVTDAIIDAVRSGDPARIRDAQFISGMVLASADPDQVGTTLNALSDTTRRRVREVDGVFFDEQTGEPIVQSPYTRIIAGPDGSFYEQTRVPTIPVLGGQTSQGGAATGSAPATEAPAQGSTGRRSGGTTEDLGAFNRPAAVSLGGQFGTVTSTVRSPEHNRDVGGAPNSFHLGRNGGRAIDIARRNGVSHAQIVSAYRRAGYGLHPDTRDEGDHSHIVIAHGPAGRGGLPRVTSRQAYERLPSGARYIAPDGTVRTKS